MARSLFLFIITAITVLVNPIALSAANEVAVTGLNPAGMVETVPLPEPEPEPVQESVYEFASSSASAEAYVAAYEPVYVAPVVQNYTVGAYIGSVGEFNSVANNLSYSYIYKYNKMIYGHNSAGLLGSLAYRYVGETITITEGGVTNNYVVSAIAMYAKTADGFLEGDKHLMTSIANTALGHDVALLTCAGTSYGNGDASHRLVVYADRV